MGSQAGGKVNERRKCALIWSQRQNKTTVLYRYGHNKTEIPSKLEEMCSPMCMKGHKMVE